MISVVTCTHNPRKELLGRVAHALKEQSLPKDQWEWIIVDNKSDVAVASWLEMGWHPTARVVREDELGLTPARLTGIAEAKHPLVVFVDDDNVLGPGYLEMADELMRSHTNLGAIGGSIEGEFEVRVPCWFERREYEMLGVRPLDSDSWGNEKGNWRMTPIGAGMVLRAEVARLYAEQVAVDEARRHLDRCGTSMISGGDDDIVNTALSMGYGMGRFADLRMLHLISKDRVEVDYLQRLAEGIGYSRQMLCQLNSTPAQNTPARWFMRVAWLRPWIVRFRRSAQLRAIDRAFANGERRANVTRPIRFNVI